jgi:hypothetical protein
VLTRAAGVLDFELVNGRLYVSPQRPGRKGALRVVPLEDPSLAIEVQTWSAMASLTYWEPYFYFGDFEHPSLSRLRAWLE